MKIAKETLMKIIKEELTGSDWGAPEELDAVATPDSPEGEAMIAATERLQSLIDDGSDITAAVAILEKEIPPNLIQYALSTVAMPSGRTASAEISDVAQTNPDLVEEPEPPLATHYPTTGRPRRPRPKADVPGDALTPADEPKFGKAKPSDKMRMRIHTKGGYRHRLKKETKKMKITQEQLKRMIREETRQVLKEYGRGPSGPIMYGWAVWETGVDSSEHPTWSAMEDPVWFNGKSYQGRESSRTTKGHAVKEKGTDGKWYSVRGLKEFLTDLQAHLQAAGEGKSLEMYSVKAKKTGGLEERGSADTMLPSLGKKFHWPGTREVEWESPYEE